MQQQIKITVSEMALKIIKKRANELGMKPATYCFNVIFEQIRREVEKSG